MENTVPSPLIQRGIDISLYGHNGGMENLNKGGGRKKGKSLKKGG